MSDNSVRQQSPQVAAMAADWPMLAALMGGTRAMRADRKTFLPQFPNEADASYKIRLSVATLHPVFKHTVSVNAARPFAKTMTVDGVSPEVDALLANVDMQGSTLASFALSAFAQCLAKGIMGVLIDCPPAPGVVTRSDEQKAGIRPYFAPYAAESILGWKTGMVNGEIGLTQLRLLENVTEDDGQFGTKSVEQVRVLTPGAWQVWRAKERDPNDWEVIDEAAMALDFVPFVFLYGIRQGFGIGESPLLELAYQNVEHYQSSSDQQNIEHVARVPILFAKKFGDAEITIGAGTAASSDEDDADLKYVEHTGAAIKSGADSIDRLEDRMRATGAELIQKGVDRTTATQVNSEGEASQSLLQQIVGVFEQGLASCLNVMSAWLKQPQNAVVTLYKNFGPTTDGDSQALTAAKAAGGTISGQTLFEELQRRDIISPDLTWADEQARMKAEAPDEAPPENDPANKDPARAE